MPKLYFRHGTVGSSKTLELLRVSYNYTQQGKKVILIKPKIDTRFGELTIKTRVGLSQDADILSENNTDIYTEVLSLLEKQQIRNVDIHCVLVDEVNFMSKKNIYGLLRQC